MDSSLARRGRRSGSSGCDAPPARRAAGPAGSRDAAAPASVDHAPTQLPTARATTTTAATPAAPCAGERRRRRGAAGTARPTDAVGRLPAGLRCTGPHLTRRRGRLTRHEGRGGDIRSARRRLPAPGGASRTSLAETSVKHDDYARNPLEHTSGGPPG